MSDVDILVAEDDRDIADLIAHYVERSGWTPHVVVSGDEALACARQRPFDVVILDVMLPGMSGLEVCRALRSDPGTSAIPIIMVTARAEETDRIIGLTSAPTTTWPSHSAPTSWSPGSAPDAPIEATRTRARRRSVRSLVMDLERHTVVDGGHEVKLTAKEFLLLQYLLQHRGRVLSRDVLLGDVWGYRYTGGTRTVDVHVRRLREKLPVLVDGLVTVKQFGYKLEEQWKPHRRH